jgi:hypothetical protein
MSGSDIYNSGARVEIRKIKNRRKVKKKEK